MRIVLIVLVFALTLYALLDCARTPEESMPARMPKFLWITLIVLFPTIGPIAWIIVSRVKAAEERGGYVEPTVWSSKEGTTFRRPERARPVAPDDDPEFLRDLEQDIRRRKHHPQTPAGGRDADESADDETGKDAGETDDSDRSGSDRH
ncbi:PLD nuclease N-terminal domain-containing protein [Actinomyces viscosus]|uniref:PLD nuclease N-terminal domain-containing protein n=1 Tax=Actinomyces viscosus TaxID=1656 RepID=UPI0028F1072F|nr:PLD nuclease N-terminal domain-containing protein [Actinomyces viscosus]